MLFMLKINMGGLNQMSYMRFKPFWEEGSKKKTNKQKTNG